MKKKKKGWLFEQDGVDRPPQRPNSIKLKKSHWVILSSSLNAMNSYPKWKPIINPIHSHFNKKTQPITH